MSYADVYDDMNNQVDQPMPTGPTVYKTTPNWQDPYHPPSPGDPYWAEWIAANPSYTGSQANTWPGGPAAPISYAAPTAANTGGAGPTAPPPAPPDVTKGALAPFNEPAPAFPQEPAFNFDAFKAPSFDEALNDPGYKFGVQQGEAALGNWAAARGTLNDSDTGKMFIDYGRNAAQQGYGNVYARDFGTWQGNEQAAERQYGMNRQTQFIDPWTAAYNAWAQRGNFYLNNQGTVANAALNFGNMG